MQKFTLEIVYKRSSDSFDFSLKEIPLNQGRALDGNLPYPSHEILSLHPSLKGLSLFDLCKAWVKLLEKWSRNPDGLNPMAKKSLETSASRVKDGLKQWLASGGLDKINTKVRDVVHAAYDKGEYPVHLILSCAEVDEKYNRLHSLMLEQLPWEQWDFKFREGVPRHALQISRSIPGTDDAARQPAKPQISGKLRLLAIFADDPKLKFESFADILNGLNRSSAISLEKFFIKETWQHLEIKKAKDVNLDLPSELRKLVKEKIADQRGWDGLLYIGHAREWNGDSFELSLHQDTKLFGRDLEPTIEKAVEQGLRCAIFIACNGLNIGYRLTQLGLHQVLVMRHEIYIEAARTFLKELCKALARQHNIRTAMQEAQEALSKEEKYYSSYLIPSLFCHPDPGLKLFQIDPSRWNRWRRDWQPRPWEWAMLGSLLLLSFAVPIQDLLLDLRIGVQAVYRDKTGQLPNDKNPPPIALVEITQEAIDRDIGADKINPMDREYLARLIDALAIIKPRVVGLNYYLNAPMTEPRSDEDPILAMSINQVLSQRQPWLIFATGTDESGHEVGVNKKIINPQQRFEGNTTLDSQMYPLRVDLSKVEECNTENSESPYQCPFPYFLAQSAKVVTRLENDHQEMEKLFDLSLNTKQPIQQRLVDQFSGQGSLERPQLQRYLQRIWAYPIIDYSISPNLAYTRISSTYLLDEQSNWLDNSLLEHLNQQIVIISSGGYIYAEDHFSVPLAMRYWQASDTKLSPTADPAHRTTTLNVLTGGQIQAYVTSQWIRSHWISAIPDWWMMILGFVCGKWIWLQMRASSVYTRRLRIRGVIGYTLYSLMTLQLYVSPGILLPWFFPTIWFMIYVIPMPKRNNDAI